MNGVPAGEEVESVVCGYIAVEAGDEDDFAV